MEPDDPGFHHSVLADILERLAQGDCAGRLLDLAAAQAIAHSVIRFAMNVIPDPDRQDTADTLEAMRKERLVLAHAVHSARRARRAKES
ncbi:hypothetical protein ACFCYB_13675 [Streptomyces sp. NPDC056309]|uniref:hypothetical protein n=1 Tax=unclassified Streptomyces TaxID=2593676 RepID=UPI0035D67CAC